MTYEQCDKIALLVVTSKITHERVEFLRNFLITSTEDTATQYKINMQNRKCLYLHAMMYETGRRFFVMYVFTPIRPLIMATTEQNFPKGSTTIQ